MTLKLHSQIETTTIHLKSPVQKEDLSSQIESQLKTRHEGFCGKYGYVIQDTVRLIDRSLGNILSVDSESFVEYRVSYEMQSIYPCKGDIMECKIDNITKMGALGYLDWSSDKSDTVSLKTSPSIFIVPEQFLDDQHRSLRLSHQISVDPDPGRGFAIRLKHL
jgi:DNA-directed RNA polymerase subunit E'/Rpb7